MARDFADKVKLRILQMEDCLWMTSVGPMKFNLKGPY